MQRVLFTNNYPMDLARAGAQRGISPRHHLWGSDALEASGMLVDYIPGDGAGMLRRATRLTGRRFGDLDVQLSVFRRRRTATAVYAANEGDLRLLAALRRGGLLKLPLFVLFHHLPNPRQGVWIRGVDVALCLSNRVSQGLRRLGMPATRIHVLHWGPDLQFAGYAPVGSRPDGPVVSAGKSGRDTAVLLAALRQLSTDPAPVRAVVYTSPSRAVNETVPDGCRLVTLPWGGHLPLESALADLREASVVAIPLLEQGRGLSGLTELADALALGKPVVMTRSPLLDIDLEAIGCGIWVAPNDTTGWVTALRSLRDDKERCRRMGQAARSFAERDLNYERFCAELQALLR